MFFLECRGAYLVYMPKRRGPNPRDSTIMNTSRFFQALSLSLLLIAIPSVGFGADEGLHVKVRSAAIRSEPKAWASALSFVSYGDSVQVKESKDGWLKVRSGAVTGYLHGSALTAKKVVLSGRETKGYAADQSEIVMAGKGFSREVEKQLAASASGMNFSAVNEIERSRVSSVELAGFIREGKLQAPRG